MTEDVVMEKQDVNELKAIMENPNINGFVSYQEQYMIFDTLLSSGINPFGSSVFHYGCGNGEFVRYAFSKLTNEQRAKTDIVNFLGYDERQEVITAAKTIYENINNVGFTTEFNLENESYDWVIAPHYFIYNNPDSENHEQDVLDSIKSLYDVCKYGTLFTMLKETSNLSEDEKESVYSPNRVEFYKSLLSITDNITIVDNYSDTEYTVFLHKIAN